MSNDDIELSIRWSAKTEDLGNEVWCSKAAADAILRLAKQKERLESRIQKLEAVAEAARKHAKAIIKYQLNRISESELAGYYNDLIAKLERE